jgi:hypothetical protein
MTALCGGGASGPRDGVAETVIYTTGSLASLLNNKGGAWASLVAPLLGVLAYSATELCNTDPPSVTALTAEEYQALLQLSPLDLVGSALGKLADMIKRAVWFELCQCTSITTPGPGGPVFPPPADVGSGDNATGTCPARRLRLNFNALTETATKGPANNITAQVLPEAQLVQGNSGSGYLAQLVAPWPANWTHDTASAEFVSGATGDSTHGYRVVMTGYSSLTPSYDLATVRVSGSNPVMHYPTGNGSFFPVNLANWQHVAFNCIREVSTDGVIDWRLELKCADTPAPSTCCPPDPVASSLIQQLLSQVNTLQRWRLPFGSVTGASHAISGTGSFAVSRCLGLLVDVTAMPAGLRQSMGNPPYIFDLGWVSLSDDGGMLQELRVTRDSQTWFPMQAQLGTSVGYALKTGVQATITELLVES